MIYSASFDRGPDKVLAEAIVVPKLKFIDADLVERCNDAALQDRPETFDRLRMNGPVNVLMRPMIDDAMRMALLCKLRVSRPVIGKARKPYGTRPH